MDELDLGYDPTYCTAIGADLNFEMTGGNLSITLPESNMAGRGIKTDGDISIFGGNITVYTKNDGGEGLESKNGVYIKGGTLIIDTYDDAINGKYHVQFLGVSVTFLLGVPLRVGLSAISFSAALQKDAASIPNATSFEQ